MKKELFLRNVNWIAHRGLSSKALENTLEAFELAAKLPFYGIECDIHLTKDNKFIVFHDYDTKRLTKINYLVKEKTLEELRELPIYIPELYEYLNICKQYNKKAVIEIKPLFTKEELKSLYNYIKDNDYLNDVIIISYQFFNLTTLRSFNNDLGLQLVTKKLDQDIIDFCLKYKIELDIRFTLATKKNIKLMKDNNLKFNVWTVNSRILANRLIKRGADYITTNGL